MKIQVLGCSAAELPNSNLSSFLIDGRILLDAGTIGSALSQSEQWKIKHVLITHAHLDHIKDLPFFADNISINNRRHQVTVMSIPQVIQALKNNLLNDIVWPDFTKIPTPTQPILRLEKINPEKTFKKNGYKITAFRVNHAVPAVGYLLEDRKGRRLLYMGDAGPSNVIWKSINNKKLDGLIIEVSFPERFKELALKTGHLTPALLEAELKKLGKAPDNVFITHCKPHYREKVTKELKKLNLNNIEILKDGAIIEL